MHQATFPTSSSRIEITYHQSRSIVHAGWFTKGKNKVKILFIEYFIFFYRERPRLSVRRFRCQHSNNKNKVLDVASYESCAFFSRSTLSTNPSLIATVISFFTFYYVNPSSPHPPCILCDRPTTILSLLTRERIVHISAIPTNSPSCYHQ